ncbi:PTS transporter subunit EIIC [Atopobiaceae bacterium HCP3S3_F7]
MMRQVQRLGGALYAPAMLFAFAGVVVGLGTLFTTEAVMGPVAAEGTAWHDAWSVVLSGGWTVFNQLPLLFAVALPIGLARKQQGRCCMEALVSYLTFNYFVNAILSAWGPALGVDLSAEVGNASGLALVGGIKTLDMGMVGALAISAVVVWLHNRLFDTELPEWLGVFSGSTFVYMVSFAAMLPCAALAAVVWPRVQVAMFALQGVIAGAGTLGVTAFVFLERALIPFGLHHLLYAPFYYDNAVVAGGIYSAWARALPQLAATSAPLKEAAPWAALTATGWSKVFGIPGVAAAFYVTAAPARRKRLLSLLVPVTLTSVLCGVTEPIEFTFLFVAPPLFLVHAALAALLATCMNLVGVVGVFSGGLIEMASFDLVPLAGSHGLEYLRAIPVGLAFTAIYFVVFRFLILRFDFKTPGREAAGETTLYSKAQYRAARAAARAHASLGGTGATAAPVEAGAVGSGATAASDGEGADARGEQARRILELLGGRDNVVDVLSCVTRLRVTVRDPALVADDAAFREAGAMGAVKRGDAVQVVVGLSVAQVGERLEGLLGR